MIFKLKNKVLAYLLVLSCFFGEIISVPQVRVMGIVPTAFRIIVPLVFILCCAERMRSRGGLVADRNEAAYFLIIVLWLCWGTCSLLLSPYSDLTRGIKELMAVFYGLMISLAVMQLFCCGAEKELIAAIRFSVIILTLLGMAELCTGLHISSSNASSPGRGFEYIPGTPFYKGPKMQVAYGISYNENDYSACIASLAPMFFTMGDKNRKTLNKVLDILTVAVILFVVKKNDADIAFLAMAVSLLLYIIITRGRSRKYYRKVSLAVAVIFLAFPIILPVFGRLMSSIFLKLEVSSNANSTVALRLVTYGKALEACIQSYGLGIGPGGFSKFVLEKYPASTITNPHSLWFEIMSEYGIVIFALFLLLFILLFLKLCKKHRNAGSHLSAVMAAAIVSLSLASFAPSTFIGYSYMWLIIGLAMAELKADKPECSVPFNK